MLAVCAHGVLYSPNVGLFRSVICQKAETECGLKLCLTISRDFHPACFRDGLGISQDEKTNRERLTRVIIPERKCLSMKCRLVAEIEGRFVRVRYRRTVDG